MSAVGNRYGSSPPSIANDAGASASTRSVAMSIPFTACLTPTMLGVDASSSMPSGSSTLPGARRDVVEDDRHRARRRHRLEVRDDPGLRRAHVVRHHDQRVRRGGHVGQRLHGGDRRGRVVRAGADDELRVPFTADARRRRRRPRASPPRPATGTRPWCRVARDRPLPRRGNRVQSCSSASSATEPSVANGVISGT